MYLNTSVKEGEGQNYHCGERCCHQHDDADLQELKGVAQHHLQPFGHHAVDGINLFGEAVEKVATGRALKEGHGRAQHVHQQIHVQVTRGDDAADGDGDSGTEDADT